MWPLPPRRPPTRLRGRGPTDSPSTLLANEAETEEQHIGNPVSPAEHQKTNKLVFWVFFELDDWIGRSVCPARPNEKPRDFLKLVSSEQPCLKRGSRNFYTSVPRVVIPSQCVIVAFPTRPLCWSLGATRRSDPFLCTYISFFLRNHGQHIYSLYFCRIL